jgi:hypothetical protein
VEPAGRSAAGVGGMGRRGRRRCGWRQRGWRSAWATMRRGLRRDRGDAGGDGRGDVGGAAEGMRAAMAMHGVGDGGAWDSGAWDGGGASLLPVLGLRCALHLCLDREGEGRGSAEYIYTENFSPGWYYNPGLKTL